MYDTEWGEGSTYTLLIIMFMFEINSLGSRRHSKVIIQLFYKRNEILLMNWVRII